MDDQPVTSYSVYELTRILGNSKLALCCRLVDSDVGSRSTGMVKASNCRISGIGQKVDSFSRQAMANVATSGK